MSKTIISADTTTQILADTADHSWIVNTGVNVTVADNAIYGFSIGDNRSFDIRGNVTSTSVSGLALEVGLASDRAGTSNTNITVASTGALSASGAAVILAAVHTTIDNAGTIESSASYGIFASGYGLTINNTGDIDSYSDGIYSTFKNMNLTNSGQIEVSNGNAVSFYKTSMIENSGTIETTSSISSAISWTSGARTESTLDNSGKISAPVTAIFGYHGSETVINSGKIIGNIDLYDGNDVFRSEGGTVKGIVHGGAGDDTYTIDNANIRLVELKNHGHDTVNSSVGYALTDNFETLVLIGGANINGNGNALDNDITGNGGNNRLSGGLGDDDLTGGKGSDIFVFKDNFGRDTIHDFAPGTDRIDLSDFSGVKNFADLMANHASKSGNDVIIHAGTDHLILDHVAKGDLHASDFIF
jgi:Ca2+-binding RTX toxin-like protein